MGLCFRKSISIFPGLKLNLSKSGVSITGGVKGLHKTVNLGTGKTTTTVGVPGTGVYYRTSSSLIKGKGPYLPTVYFRNPAVNDSVLEIQHRMVQNIVWR